MEKSKFEKENILNFDKENETKTNEKIGENLKENTKSIRRINGENNFKKGLNCCQAVLLSFSDSLNLSEETLLMLGSPFGGGMGKLREVCGAVSSMFIIAGLKYGYTDVSNQEAKANHYKLIQELAEKFKEENHSIICRELLQGIATTDSLVTYAPEKRSNEYYKKRPCSELVGCAIGIIENLLEKK